MVPCRRTFVQKVCEDWRMAATFRHAVAQRDTLRDGYVSLLAFQSSTCISHERVLHAHDQKSTKVVALMKFEGAGISGMRNDQKSTKHRVTSATMRKALPAPHSGLNNNTKTIQGTISRFAKEELDMRRAIAHGMAFFRQHGGNTLRLQCVFGPLATPGARKLFMRCVRCRARSAVGLRQRLA